LSEGDVRLLKLFR